MNNKSQAATVLAFMLALLLGILVIEVSPTEIQQTITVYPGNSTKIVSGLVVNNGMVINLTESFCNFTSPTGVSIFISPMTVEGAQIYSPYRSCVNLGLDLRDIGEIDINMTINDVNAQGFNQSVFDMDNNFIKFRFSPSDTIRIFVNESADDKYKDFIRLGWLDGFFKEWNDSWDNRTDAKFFDFSNRTTLMINFTQINQTIIYNVTMYDYSPTIFFNITMYGENDTIKQSHYPGWYPETWINVSHKDYVWPQIVRLYDEVWMGELYNASQGTLDNRNHTSDYLEFYDSTGERTNITLVVPWHSWMWFFNKSDIWDNSSQRYEVFRMALVSDEDPPNITTRSFAFTFTPIQTQQCVGSGDFNMTCDYTPSEAGVHNVNVTIEYFYLNVSTPKYNGTFILSNLTWFNVTSQPLPNCTETAACDSCLDKLNNEACDCADECNSNICLHSVCRPTSPFCGDTYCEGGETCASCATDCGNCPPPGGGGIPPGGGDDGGDEPTLEPNMTLTYPIQIVLYMNETTQFRIDVENSGDIELNNVMVSPGTSTASIRIIPEYYSFINVSERRIFLVDATPTDLVNETVEFDIESDQLSRSINIPFVVFPARDEINVSEIIAEKNRLEEIIYDTSFILNSLLENNYDVETLLNNLDDADENLTEAEQMIHQERYSEAKTILDDIPIVIEDIYTSMERLQRLPSAPFAGSEVMLVFLIILVGISAIFFIYILFIYKRMPGH